MAKDLIHKVRPSHIEKVEISITIILSSKFTFVDKK